jgi:8-oxo-dGTP pyrophosphatase MutT (NUDIX family)
MSDAKNDLGLSFGSGAEPMAPRLAATVLVLREHAGALEVYCILRHPKSGFLGGAVAFPGGKVDEADGHAEWQRHVQGAPLRSELIASDSIAIRSLGIAAARETLEEAGLFPAPIDEVQAGRLRAEIAKGTPLRTAVSGLCHIELDRFVTFARWVTPEAEPKRFDAAFFLLALPHGQIASADEHEVTGGFWATPDHALGRFERGEIMLAPPTTRCLELLRGLATIQEAFDVALKQTLSPICPQFVPGDPPMLSLPGDPTHSVKEVRVAGPTRFVLRDGKFLSEDP